MTRKKKITMDMFNDLSTEEIDETIASLRELNKKNRAVETKHKKKYKPQVEQALGQYILSRIGLDCYQVNAEELKKIIEDVKFDKEALRVSPRRSANYQLSAMRKLKRVSRSKTSKKQVIKKIEDDNTDNNSSNDMNEEILSSPVEGHQLIENTPNF